MEQQQENLVDEQQKRKKFRRSNSPLNEFYRKMEVPEHIYVAGMPRQPSKSDTKPQMVVPSRITVAGGDTTVASKAHPVEVLRERQTLLPSSESENIGMDGIPEMLTANELPAEVNTSEMHYSSHTSIAIDNDPLKELKLMRRRLNRLTNRVTHLELQGEENRNEKTYLWGIVSVSTLLSIALFASHIRMWLNR